jgi:hypothetical protein
LPDAPAPKQDQQDAPEQQQKNIWQSPMGLIARKSFFIPSWRLRRGR